MASGISISGKEVADGGFCCEAWERSTALRETIYGMPFVLELGAGTLPQEVFQGYVLQDSAYLVEVLVLSSTHPHRPIHLEAAQCTPPGLAIHPG